MIFYYIFLYAFVHIQSCISLYYTRMLSNNNLIFYIYNDSSLSLCLFYIEGFHNVHLSDNV